MKKLLAASAILLAVTATNPAYAVNLDDFKRPSREEFKKMTPEEKVTFMDERKAKWDKLSKKDKVEVIEHRRAEKIKAMDEHWAKMSDDEKIAFVEKRMEKKREWIKNGGKGRPPFGGHHDGPPHEDKGL